MIEITVDYSTANDDDMIESVRRRVWRIFTLNRMLIDEYSASR